MPVSITARRPSPTSVGEPAILAALARAAASVARLDQATARHPLLPALLHRARLDAVRRQAAVDGQLIDPWHLAALIEGLRPRRMAGALSIAEAGGVFEAGRTALTLHRWLTAPDFDEEGEARQAVAALAASTAMGVTVLDAAHGAWRWLEDGGRRAPLRAAMTRHWVSSGLLRAPLPLTGAAALRAEADWDLPGWTRAFLVALADEADDILNLLYDLERGWGAARRAVAGHRRHSHTPRAVDLLAAVPLISATTLARALGISIKSALAILDALRRDGIAVEVTGRAARRLFGLAGLAPLAAAVAPPRRPEPGRGRGRPRLLPPPDEAPPPPLPPAAPLGPAAWQGFDYSDLDAAMAAVDAAIRGARRGLDRVVRGDDADRAEGVDGHDDDKPKDDHDTHLDE
ncbi:hypothetical protein [Falsiroseomonas sp.]|uniref:hypothetical protein n=1 Tax=Falsiroseomonas sp. TaxID=2870721 RepID=UPI003F70922D